MKNRLIAYLGGMKLATLHLVQAREDIGENKTNVAVQHVISAMDEMIVAMNNFTSIAFNAKPKRNRK